MIRPEKDQKIVDTVAYEKLIAGEEYELTTWLTKDGKKIWGTEVTKKFTAKEADGTVTVELTFDASKHGGEDITVFEAVSLHLIHQRQEMKAPFSSGLLLQSLQQALAGLLLHVK